ncbi:MAG TPA: carboxypeptidase-like regulatory domain-containing protein [Planctomycetota bacterium]|nr:carboxypeptidase-like regulatory domain-containing protein [Planctomycetota bacterium]
MVWLGVLTVLAAAGLFWLSQGESATVADATHAPRDAVPAPAPVVAAEPTPATAIERAEVPDAALPAASDATLAHVKGRCVDEDGKALAGCTAKFDGWGRAGNDVAMQGKVEWHDPEPVVIRDDGRFDFAFAPPSGFQFTLELQADARGPRTGRWGRIEPAQLIDLGDITLRRGFAVRGRVVDEQGAAVARVGVNLRNLPLPIAQNMAANDTRYGLSDATGSFTIEVPIPAGTWSLDVDSRGQRLVSPDRVTVDPVRGAEPVLVVVRSQPSIEGIVVDEQSLAVEGVGISVEVNRSGRMASGRSKKDGTFMIFAVDAEPKPAKLQIDYPGPCEPSWHDDRLWEWGSKDVRIVLKRALAFELTVVERGNGAPVTRYAVSCWSEPLLSSLQQDLRLSGEHEGGRVTVDRVWRSKTRLTVAPLDPALLPSASVDFEVTDDGVPPIRVEVERMQPAVVRATTPGNTPVVGSKVEVIAKSSQPLRIDEYVADPRLGKPGSSSDPKFRFHELRSSGITDQEGRASVLVPDDHSQLAVRVTGSGHPSVLVDPALFPLTQDLVVVVPEGGAIVGTVKLQGIEPGRMSLQLEHGNGQQLPRRNRDAAVLGADGRFAFRGLAPGSYRIALAYSATWQTEHGGIIGAVPLDLQVPEVAVEAGRDTEVTIDATAFVLATVRGRVLVNGGPPGSCRVFLQLGGGPRFGQYTPAADGAFEATGLLPGSYRAGLVVGDFQAGEGDQMLCDDTFVLAGGEQLARDFALVRRRLVLRLLLADGKTPVANEPCECRSQGLNMRRTTDTDGRCVFDPAPAGAFQVYSQKAGDTPLGPFEIPAGKMEHELTLTSPAVKAK